MDKFVVCEKRKTPEQDFQTEVETEPLTSSSKSTSQESQSLQAPPYPYLALLPSSQSITTSDKITILSSKWTDAFTYNFPSR